MSAHRLESPDPPVGSPAWRSLRWRRIFAGLSILFLLAATHVPKLTLGPDEDSPDKLVHLMAYAVVTVLVRIAFPGRSLVPIALCMAGLAVIDEATQAVPGLGRTFDPLDLLADAGGVAIALAWCRALSPPRAGPDWWSARYRQRLAGCRLLLAGLQNWLHLAVAGSLGAMVIGVLLVLVGRNPVVGPLTMLVVGASAGLVAGVVGACEIGRRHAAGRMRRERLCIDCLLPVESSPCPTCGCDEPVEAVDSDPTRFDRRIYLLATTMLVVVAVLLVLGYLGLQELRYRLVRPWPVFSWYDRLPVADAMSVDAIILGLVGAFAVARFRRAAARLAASEGRRCRGCGHDLRGTPDESGSGRCPECGRSFLRGSDSGPAFASGVSSGDDAGR